MFYIRLNCIYVHVVAIYMDCYHLLCYHNE